MQKLPVFPLFVIIVLEGYLVLSSELLAIRLSVPYVGSGTDTVSIIIAAVLMPLAFGYQSGGHFKPGRQENGRYHSVRARLLRNLFIALLFLLPGLSYVVLHHFFENLIIAGVQNRLIMTALYAGIFLVTPVYLLGQTIPLISHYFRRERLARITGKILCFSTLGSFLGAIFSTLILMAYVGVHFSAALNFIILCGLIVLLQRKKAGLISGAAALLALIGVALNSGTMLGRFDIISNNQYNTAQIYHIEGERHLFLNNNASSMLSPAGRKYRYIEYIESLFLHTRPQGAAPLEILVIGAGGFTLGSEDRTNHYDFVDIDKSLKEISEQYILQEKLGPNKVFHPIPVRAFLTGTDKTYDLIVLDAYLGDLTLPEHLVTADFFAQIKAHVNTGGYVTANFILTPTLSDPYSQHIDNTFRRVFPHAGRQNVQFTSPWDDTSETPVNAIYSYQHGARDATGIYTDDINRVYTDKN